MDAFQRADKICDNAFHAAIKTEDLQIILKIVTFVKK